MPRREPERVQRARYQCECGLSPLVKKLDDYTFSVSCPCGKELTLSWRSEGPPPMFEKETRS